MSNWTPGPWRLSPDRYWLVVANDPRRPGRSRKVADAFCGVRCGNTDHAESDSDARLIALAPELAEAILAIADTLKDYGPDYDQKPICVLADKLRAIGGDNE